MINQNELMSGNIVYDSMGQPIEIAPSEFDRSSIEPIPLTDNYCGILWIHRCGYSKNVQVIPKWIKYVHEYQNWYYWWNNKTKLKVDLT